MVWFARKTVGEARAANTLAAGRGHEQPGLIKDLDNRFSGRNGEYLSRSRELHCKGASAIPEKVGTAKASL